MHFETGVVGTSAWVGRQAAKLNIQSEFKRFKTKENVKKVMANSATRPPFPGPRKQAKSTSILLAKMAQINTNFAKFSKISKMQVCTLHRCVFNTNVHICEHTLCRLCTYMYMHIYVYMHAYVYGCKCASMILLDMLRCCY